MAVKRILFVSHDASRSGAPIVLLTFFDWLKKNTGTEITVLLKQTGPLYNEFSMFGTVYCWAPQTPKRLKHDLLSRVKRKLKKTDPFIPFPAGLAKQDFDLVYLNTAASLDLAHFLKSKYECPVIVHVHEMEYSIRDAFYLFFTEQNKQSVDHFIAVCKNSKAVLIEDFGIEEKNISLLYEFIDIEKFRAVKQDIQVTKNALSLKNEFIVGAAGSPTWRKGFDLFIHTAAYVKRNFPDVAVKFIWVGNIDHALKSKLDYELVKLRLEDMVIFTGEQTLPANYFQVFDIFFLSSREDPFPLVCLEAAALKKPVICFKQAGGINEFIEKGGGISIEYGNLEAVAKSITWLSQNKTELNKLGNEAVDSVRNYDVHSIAPELFNLVNKISRQP